MHSPGLNPVPSGLDLAQEVVLVFGDPASVVVTVSSGRRPREVQEEPEGEKEEEKEKAQLGREHQRGRRI